jgi:hypothetical protein
VVSVFLRTLVTVALLLVLPFGGMRVICVAESAESDDPASSTATVAAPHERELTECERLCPLHGIGISSPDSDSDSDSGSDRCALSAGASSLMAAAGIAVIRPLQPPPDPIVARTVYVDVARFAPEPVLPRFVPPPRSEASL